MKKLLLIVSLTTLLLSGCEKTYEVEEVVGVDKRDLPRSTTCVDHGPPAPCPDRQDRNNPRVTLNLNTMMANPPNVCAHPGTTLEVSLVPPEVATTIEVFLLPKDFADTWLLGTNNPDKENIHVPIPASIPPDESYWYEYGFVTSTGECTDPRLRVE